MIHIALASIASASLAMATPALVQLPDAVGYAYEQMSYDTLDLSNGQFTAWPDDMAAEWGHYEMVDLHNNGLANLPPEIGQLKNLQKLSLSGNSLANLPPEIVQLKNLQELYLYYNNLTELSVEMSQLRHLRILDVRGNDNILLPPDLISLPNLEIWGYTPPTNTP